MSTSTGVNVRFPFDAAFPNRSGIINWEVAKSLKYLQVLRWGALAVGVLYGFSHQLTLSASAKSAQIDRDYAHKQSLIQQAKAEWTKKTMPAEKKTEGGGIITDPNDSRFDLEAYLNMKAAE
ncbi:MAG: hypothetical protein M1824_006300 [Vezdaea acicularis]|nr:MAG: hypothetical protein M1824_006300 [Vezdaea acicularis]